MAKEKKNIKLTNELMLKAIDDFANGEKLKEVYSKLNTTRTAFNDALKKYDLIPNYARARELHGDGFNSELEAIKQDLKLGKIDSSTARVLIDAIKWQAGKFYPKMYGDSLKIDADVNVIPTIIFENASKTFDFDKDGNAIKKS